MTRKMLFEGLIFSLAAGLAAHLLYGALGFCPTDEGYMLSGSRRLLDGQIPHRDYISLRPVGTQILHAHLLLWAGERLIWWSRLLAWIQVAATSWLWIMIAGNLSRGFESRIARWIVALIAFLASTHSFPIMPWNTYDGLFFISIGIVISRLAPRFTWLAMLSIGLSTTFRQNFVFPIPFLLMALGEFRRIRSWILVALPGSLYCALVFASGGFRDMMIQMSSHKGSLLQALFPITAFPMPFAQGLIMGGIGAAALHHQRPSLKLFGNVILAAGLCYAALILPFADEESSIGWFLFAMLLAAAPFLRRMTGLLRLTALTLVTGWGVSISEGHPQPTLIAGALVITLASIMLALEQNRTGTRTPVFHAGLALALVIALYAFHRGRVARINCDLNAEYLTHELGDALPGARGIRTNPNTHALLSDLTRLTSSLRAAGRPVAVVPECTQFWVLFPQRNPLSTDWPVDPELRGDELMNRVLGEIETLRGHTTFIVQKYWVVLLPFRRAPIRDDESAVVARIRKSCRKVGETEYFEIYE